MGQLRVSAKGFHPLAGRRGTVPGGQHPASSCVDGSYQVGDRSYPMPCHGFAMSMPWQLASHSADRAGARVSVELRDSEKTRASYPFGFLVRVTYELSSGSLTILSKVTAASTNAGPMPFSMGNHMSFRVPFVKGTDPEEMLFQSPNSFELLRDSHGLVTLSGSRAPLPLHAAGDFNATAALPLAGYRGAPYALLADPGGLALRITQRASSELPEPLVRFNVYGAPAQGFLSPEPWFGLQNSLNLKQGVVTLAPGADWEWTVELQPEMAAQRRELQSPEEGK